MFETTQGFFFFLFFSLILLLLCSPRIPMIERPVEKIKDILEKKPHPQKKQLMLIRSKQKEEQPYELQPDPRVYQNQPERKEPRFIEEPPLQPQPALPPLEQRDQIQQQQLQQQLQQQPPIQELPSLPEHPYPMTPEELPGEPVPFGDDVGCPL